MYIDTVSATAWHNRFKVMLAASKGDNVTHGDWSSCVEGPLTLVMWIKADDNLLNAVPVAFWSSTEEKFTVTNPEFVTVKGMTKQAITYRMNSLRAIGDCIEQLHALNEGKKTK